jgi:hypothetical protein
MHHLEGVTVAQLNSNVVLTIPVAAIMQAATRREFDQSENDYAVTDREKFIASVAERLLTLGDDNSPTHRVQALRTFLRMVIESVADEGRGVEFA